MFCNSLARNESTNAPTMDGAEPATHSLCSDNLWSDTLLWRSFASYRLEWVIVLLRCFHHAPLRIVFKFDNELHTSWPMVTIRFTHRVFYARGPPSSPKTSRFPESIFIRRPELEWRRRSPGAPPVSHALFSVNKAGRAAWAASGHEAALGAVPVAALRGGPSLRSCIHRWRGRVASLLRHPRLLYVHVRVRGGDLRARGQPSYNWRRCVFFISAPVSSYLSLLLTPAVQ